MSSGFPARTAPATQTDANVASLRAHEGVANVEQRGDTVLVQCSNSDIVARHLLTTTAARDLEISSKNLEAAFVALTADTVAGSNGATR